MGIDIADPSAMQSLICDEIKNRSRPSDRRGGDLAQTLQHHLSISESAKRNFPEYIGVEQKPFRPKQAENVAVLMPKMVDPDIRVDDQQGGSSPSFGAHAFGSLPPISASCRAASRSTSFLRACRISVLRSVIPVSSAASASNSSSSVTVVRMRVN
jgi:hypothetical protein